jgi:hypothetical protein
MMCDDDDDDEYCDNVAPPYLGEIPLKDKVCPSVNVPPGKDRSSIRCVSTLTKTHIDVSEVSGLSLSLFVHFFFRI